MKHETNEEGRFITVGGHMNPKTHKKSGGHVVFIKNGSIQSGHHSLKDGHITPLEDSEPREETTREINKQSREESRQFWRKASKAAGVPWHHVSSLANQFIEHHNAHAAEHNDILKAARQSLADSGHGYGAGALKANISRGRVEEPSQVKRLDVIAEGIARQHPERFPHGSDYSAKLFDMFAQGNLSPMTEAQALSEAHSYLVQSKAERRRMLAESVPFSLDDGSGHCYVHDSPEHVYYAEAWENAIAGSGMELSELERSAQLSIENESQYYAKPKPEPSYTRYTANVLSRSRRIKASPVVSAFLEFQNRLRCTQMSLDAETQAVSIADAFMARTNLR
jgi:hypothetical protein